MVPPPGEANDAANGEAMTIVTNSPVQSESGESTMTNGNTNSTGQNKRKQPIDERHNVATDEQQFTEDSKRRATDSSVIVPQAAAASTAAKKSMTEEERIAKMSTACKTILECIGEDPNREGLAKTPERWAKALMFFCHGYDLTAKQVISDAVFSENHNEMVVVRNIDIHSLCEHHMVPFTGRCHIGYVPNGKVVGLSKLARLAEMYARRLQVQERLTRQIADAVVETIQPLGVAVVVESSHLCMVMRGVQKTSAITTTSSVRGCFESNPKTRAEFFSILHGNSPRFC